MPGASAPPSKGPLTWTIATASPTCGSTCRSWASGARQASFATLSPETSNIIFEWTFYEMREYLRRHRCLIAGAEASLLRELWRSAAYREPAAEVLPHEVELAFHQVRETAANTREARPDQGDLRREMQRLGATRSSSRSPPEPKCSARAGPGARCPGHRLRQHGARARLRRQLRLQACRDMHNPFFFRVPFYALVLPALERAFPGMTTAELAARAHAQLALELLRHARFTFNVSEAPTAP